MPPYEKKDERESTPPTELMMRQLKSEKDFDVFARDNDDEFVSDDIARHFDMLLKKHIVDKSEAIRAADIDRTFGYQILSGKRDTKRDNFIRLAIGIGLDDEDTQRLLKIAKKGVLYPRVKRDAAILFCINNRYNLIRTQQFLFDLELDPLE